jgi:hypothetical protein
LSKSLNTERLLKVNYSNYFNHNESDDVLIGFVGNLGGCQGGFLDKKSERSDSSKSISTSKITNLVTFY